MKRATCQKCDYTWRIDDDVRIGNLKCPKCEGKVTVYKIAAAAFPNSRMIDFVDSHLGKNKNK